MSKYPYPIDLNNVSLDRYLTNLLSALVEKAGGTLKISVADILKVQDSVLLRYPTSDMSKIVLQLAPANTDMYVVPEAPSWQAEPRKAAPRAEIPKPVDRTASPTPPTSPRIASTLDNLSLYLKEQEREEKLREIQQEDEVEERRRVGLSPFRVIPGK